MMAALRTNDTRFLTHEQHPNTPRIQNARQKMDEEQKEETIHEKNNPIGITFLFSMLFRGILTASTSLMDREWFCAKESEIN